MRYQQGDRGAFRSLVRRHGVSVYNFMLRQLGSALVADEVAQRVFLAVVSDPGAFGREGGFRARLFQVAMSLCRKQRTTAARAGRSASDALDGAQAEADAIRAAVDSLDVLQKDVFLLREVAKLGFDEIGLVLGQGPLTVKIAMHQALRRLQEQVQDLEMFRQAVFQQDRLQSSTR